MTLRTRMLLTAFALGFVALAAMAAVPQVARADSLSWGAGWPGPADIINGAAETPVASGLNAVSFADATHGWAVGVRVDNPSGGTRYSFYQFTNDGGVTWTSLSIPGSSAEIYGVLARSSTEVWAVGASGTLLKYNGVSWESRSVAGWTAGKAFRAIAFSGSTGWAVGDGYGVALTTDGGSTWSTLVAPGTTGALRAVAAVESGAYAVGDSSTGGAVMKYLTAAGSSSRSPGTSSGLYGIAFDPDGVNGCAVGADAAIVRTSNGGASWSAATGVPLLPGTAGILAANGLRAVTFLDGMHAVAVGKYQGVWRTLDGGVSWRLEQIPGDTGGEELRGVAFVPGSIDHLIAVGRAYDTTLNSGSQKSRAYRGTWDRIDLTPPTTTSDTRSAYVGSASITLSSVDVESGIAHTYWKLDGGVQNEGTTISVSSAGAHHIEFWSVDAAPAHNEETPHKTADFTITVLDVTAPETASDRVPSYMGPATIHLSATDTGGSGVAHTYYMLDGGPPTEALTVSTSAEGHHTLEFWSVDVALNEETPHKTAEFTITLPDTTPPTTTSDAVVSYDSAATISLTATDTGGSGVAHTYWRLDGGAPTEGTTIIVSAEGAHTLEFWSVDVALNEETPHKTAHFSVITPPPPDTTRPTTTSNASATYVSSATISLSATDTGGSGVAHTYWRLDSGTQTEGTTVFTSAGGAHTLEFWSVDVALNEETPHKTAHFTVTIPDVVAPVTDSDAQSTYLWTATIGLTASDTGGSGVAHTYWRLDGGAQTEGTTVITSTGGAHTLEFWSVDVAGNSETPHKGAGFVVTVPPLSVDTTPPVTTWPGYHATFVTRASIVLAASDGSDGTGVAGTRYRLDTGAETSGTALTVTKTGAHTLYFWSIDKAGMIEAQNHLHFTVLIKTAVSITSNHTSIVRRHTVVFTGHVSSNLGHNNHVEVWVKKPGSSKWVKLSTRHTTSTHHWSYAYAPTIKGAWYFQARFPGTSKYAPSTSTLRGVKVR